jgi:SAM-dependent methyltransferase
MSQHLHFWNARYQDSGDNYLFGTEPCRFLTHRAPRFERGHSALCVADGEGRHSVWLAEQGLAVTAVDIAPAALAKAKKLAAGREVEVTFEEGDLLAGFRPQAVPADGFDWVVGIFIQFANASERPHLFASMRALTAPGGRLLLLGYTPQQLEYKTGGPSALENLYTQELLEREFADWQIEELVEFEEEIAEGRAHRGRSALIGLCARKPAATVAR